VTFIGLDIISLLNLILYMYEDRVIPAWNYTRHDPSLAYRYRQIRTEVVRTASNLDLLKLEAAAQKQVDPQRQLDEDMRSALEDPQFFVDADAVVELDGDEWPVHSSLLCQRCPFFEGLFYGRSQGMWLASRLAAQGPAERVPVDLKHIDPGTFNFVRNYLYADTGDQMFDGVVTDNLDEFTDLVMDVLSVANELMLDRLSEICQQVLARFINTRNIAHFLNAISPCSVTEFKDAGLEYITLQLENMLENNLLSDLDEELLLDLDEVVRGNQLARYPFARSGRATLLLHERYPHLAHDIDEERQRRVREMAFKANQKEDERKLSSSLKGKFGSLEDIHPASPSMDRSKGKEAARRNEPFSPDLRPKAGQADLMFDMDEDEGPLESPSLRPERGLSSSKKVEIDQIPALGESFRGQKPKPIRDSPLGSSPACLGLPSTSATGKPSATPSVKSGNPWASAKLPTAKLDLREIMNETPPARSALSAGLAAQQAKEASVKPSQTKMSQKERKRLQQLQVEQAAEFAKALSDKTPWEKPKADSRPSPWKAASSQFRVASEGGGADAPKSAPPITTPLVAAEASAKTVARRTQSPDTRHSGQSRTPAATPPTRPPPRTSSTSTFSADMSNKPVVPHSKSYIKPAAKSEPIIGLSMADIIDQERRTLESAKEAVAKRSLMEIQQEQAFQEWWEEESRRTQEEEARRSNRDKEREEGKNSKGRRGRSGKSRGGGGRGAGAGGGANPGPVSGAATGPQGEPIRIPNQDTGRGGRGNRRSRGRGGGGGAAAAAAKAST
jgi:inhibitor of Bruton tyrosine kinase